MAKEKSFIGLDFVANVDNWTGDVRVHLTELIPTNNSSLATTFDKNEYDFFVSRNEVLDFIAKNCQQNIFSQCNLEREINSRFHSLKKILLDRAPLLHSYRDSTGYPWVSLNYSEDSFVHKKLTEAVLYVAMIAVFKNSGAYDNYYGGGTNEHPGFCFVEYLRGRRSTRDPLPVPTRSFIF